MRLPKRSWVFSLGGFSFASKPQRIARAEPAKAPTSLTRGSAQSPPSRRSASTRTRSASKVL